MIKKIIWLLIIFIIIVTALVIIKLDGRETILYPKDKPVLSVKSRQCEYDACIDIEG